MNSGECGILEAWCYTRAVGQRRSLAESHLIPGNSREDSGEEGNPRVLLLFEVLCLYQGSVVDCIDQVKSRFCLYQVTSKILFISGHFQDSVYTRSLPRFCLYQVTSKILFIPGGVLLFTPVSVGQRALG